MVVLSRAFLREHFLFFTYLSYHTTRTLSTSRTSPSSSVDKLRHQESLWREDMQRGGNPRTTTPTGYEPKELATASRIVAYSGDPYQLYDVQEKCGEEDHRAPITREVKVFGEMRTAGVPEFKLSETSYIQSRMHFDDSVESIADSDLEDGELQKILTSPPYAQKASVKPRCNGHAGERGKCTIHSSRSKGKFEVSFIWRSESFGEMLIRRILRVWTKNQWWDWWEGSHKSPCCLEEKKFPWCYWTLFLPHKVPFFLTCERLWAIRYWTWALLCGHEFRSQNALFLWTSQRKMSLQVWQLM